MNNIERLKSMLDASRIFVLFCASTSPGDTFSIGLNFHLPK